MNRLLVIIAALVWYTGICHAQCATPQVLERFELALPEQPNQLGTLVAHTLLCEHFRNEAAQWSLLEQAARSAAASAGQAQVVLVYQNRFNVPVLQEVLGGLNPQTANPADLEPLLEWLNEDCLLVFIRLGRQGTLLQYPAQKREELRQMLHQFR